MAIPRPGLELEAPGKVDGPLESVVGLSLSDDMIEDMIKCFQDGQSLELTLGSTKVGCSLHNKLDYAAVEAIAVGRLAACMKDDFTCRKRDNCALDNQTKFDSSSWNTIS
jgi:hypothetical protein